jgi:hypothetical protein
MNLELVNQIAKAVLYEGYMLYPYRPSSVKNQQRWNFGVLYPPFYSRRQTGSDTCKLESQCLIHCRQNVSIEVRVRFLQLVQRSIGLLKLPVRELAPGELPEVVLVDSVVLNGRLLQSWQEATEREIAIPNISLGSLPISHHFELSLQTQTEPIRNDQGEIAAVIVRTGERISGSLSVSAERLNPETIRLSLVVENLTRYEGDKREDALLSSMVSAHIVLGVENGKFVSLLEPPESLRESAAACRNVGVWPVLVGAEGDHNTLLISPIILYDYPQIAPESAGDLFDGTEIDEILSLRIMTLTDDEKREMRQSDVRAQQILERTETLPQEQFMKLHGVLRGLRPVREGRHE